jgi:hypothetical protein
VHDGTGSKFTTAVSEFEVKPGHPEIYEILITSRRPDDLGILVSCLVIIRVTEKRA